jgi:DNA recombination protein RmuC
VLGGAKTRGALGEVALERMLEDALPRSAYEAQYRFSTGATVDVILRIGDKIVSVDSKFPLDAYRRMLDATEDTREATRREFAKAVRTHADSIAEKYIVPAEGTLAYAFMFVPSEGVYYEFLMTEDPRTGSLAEYCRRRQVIAVSPNVFYAYLHTILMGLRGMQIEQRARELLASLAGLRNQVEIFAEVYEKLGTHLRYAQQNYEDADHKLERARAVLDQMAQGALPESPVKALEAASKE